MRGMILRFCKILLAAGAGVLILLVALNNIMDFDTNYVVVSHVMSMDDIPDGTVLSWRAITSPALHKLVYIFIIATEFVAALVTLYGASLMWSARANPAAEFTAAKEIAAAGLVVAVWLYLFGFMAVGGEWFQMWRAANYDLQQAAFRFIGCVALALIFLNQRDGEV